MTKPTSKIIQISTTRCPDNIPVVYSLCEDGSLWELYQGQWSEQTNDNNEVLPNLNLKS